MATLLGLQSHLALPKTTVKPFAVLNKADKMRIPFQLKQGQNRRYHQLPSGLNMEVIEQTRESNDKVNPPLVFVHGSYHAAWCWAEHWLPFFSASGFDCYAVSLLGQVKTFSFLAFLAFFFSIWLCSLVYLGDFILSFYWSLIDLNFCGCMCDICIVLGLVSAMYLVSWI